MSFLKNDVVFALLVNLMEVSAFLGELPDSFLKLDAEGFQFHILAFQLLQPFVPRLQRLKINLSLLALEFIFISAVFSDQFTQLC
jgi:hypothetical protein